MKKLEYKLNHVDHWFTLFIFLHNIKPHDRSINNLIGDGKT
jgi:hypothetical protein